MTYKRRCKIELSIFPIPVHHKLTTGTILGPLFTYLNNLQVLLRNSIAKQAHFWPKSRFATFFTKYPTIHDQNLIEMAIITIDLRMSSQITHTT